LDLDQSSSLFWKWFHYFPVSDLTWSDYTSYICGTVALAKAVYLEGLYVALL